MNIPRLVQVIRRSLERHGGGLKGWLSLGRRSVALASAVGVRGLVSRLRAAGAPRRPLPQIDQATFPAPEPLQAVTLNVGVMAHVFYPELIEEFAQSLDKVPVPFTLLVSVMDMDAEAQVRARFRQMKRVRELIVRVVPNRGRDIAPFLISFNAELRALDVVAHIHTKKSLYTGNAQDAWRRYLLNGLFGDAERVAWILGTFQAAPQLGLVYPDTYEILPPWAHTWLDNANVAGPFATRLGVPIERNAYFDFPAGSMFWARVPALLPLLDLGLRLEDFPTEQGQTDGTVQHALERLFALAARAAGFRLGIMPSDGSQRMLAEGERNGAAALQAPVREKLQHAAAQARLITVDVFDTIVVRPFLHPSGSRGLLDVRVLRLTGRANYASLREDAEAAARMALGRDPTLTELLNHAVSRQQLSDEEAAALGQVELDMERRLLQPRDSVLEGLAALDSPHVIALSDMYLPADDLRDILPERARALTQTWKVSCETGMRKDQEATWPTLAQLQGVAMNAWLHVGDNEHSDIQVPQRAGLLNPVHILRPAAVLDIVPALRALRCAEDSAAPWPEQLWRGLLANQWADVADRTPQALAGTPVLDAAQTGYQILGPLLLDMLLATVESAQRHGAGAVLLLAREGFLIEQAWKRLSRDHEGARALRATYFLASRKATLLAALHTEADLSSLLTGSFNGTLEDLLSARIGEGAIAIARPLMDERLLERAVFLPEMSAEVAQWLEPVIGAWLQLAATQRSHYLRYWNRTAGDVPCMVVDIGYAGTIQRNLCSMSGREIGGLYFALRAGARQLDGVGWAEARYFDGRERADEDSPILAHDLLLEALLTAPHGQFEGFEENPDGMPQPIFGAPTLDPEAQQILAQVHDGALRFIDHACAAAGEDIASARFEPEHVLGPLRLMGQGHWKAGPWLDALSTEDHFSGRGLVKATLGLPTSGQTPRPSSRPALPR